MPSDSQPFSLKWTFATASNVRSSPVVVDGVVYVGSDDGRMYALDAATGTQRWSFAVNANMPVRSSATLVDGFLYIGSQGGTAAGQFGYLYKLAANVGTQCWQYRYGTSRLDVDHAPAVNFGVAFARHGGTFVGVSISNGAPLWQYRYNTINRGPLGAAMDGGTLYAPGSDNVLYAADVRDEQQIWRQTGHHCAACIVLLDETRMIYCGGYSVQCHDRATGTRLWRTDLGSGLDFTPDCSPAVGWVWTGASSSQLVFACIKTNLYALRATNGSQLWRRTAAAEFHSSPALVGNMLFIGNDDGRVYALDAATGERVWDYPTGGPVCSSPWIDAHGVLYVGSDDGNVYAFNTGIPEPALWGALPAGLMTWYAVCRRPALPSD